MVSVRITRGDGAITASIPPGRSRSTFSRAVTPALENVALWHERDISHSSVERFIGPDATITLDFALARLTGVVDKLVVYPERMRANLESTGGLIYTSSVLPPDADTQAIAGHLIEFFGVRQVFAELVDAVPGPGLTPLQVVGGCSLLSDGL